MAEKQKTEVATGSQQPQAVQKDITAQVLTKINSFVQTGELKMPKDYSYENALKGALLTLQELKDKDGVLFLDKCSKTSIAQSLFKMCIEGLSPLKKQGYFIAYGNELQWQRSYQGSISLAKRVGNVKDVVANVVYKQDQFEFSVDLETGYKKIVRHDQKIENIDNSQIVGAYAVIIYEDGRKDLEVMTFPEIVQAWKQGKANGNSGAHNNFTQEMCKKTVINRACKGPINSSTDAGLFSDDDQQEQPKGIQETPSEIKREIIQDTAVETVNFEEIKEVKTETEQVLEASAAPGAAIKANDSFDFTT